MQVLMKHVLVKVRELEALGCCGSAILRLSDRMSVLL